MSHQSCGADAGNRNQMKKRRFSQGKLPDYAGQGRRIRRPASLHLSEGVLDLGGVQGPRRAGLNPSCDGGHLREQTRRGVGIARLA